MCTQCSISYVDVYLCEFFGKIIITVTSTLMIIVAVVINIILNYYIIINIIIFIGFYQNGTFIRMEANFNDGTQIYFLRFCKNNARE